MDDCLLTLMFPAFPGPELTQSLSQTLLLGFGLQLITTMFSLLLAWAVVPGAHVRRFSGLIVASILIVAFNYAAILLVSQIFAR